MHFSVKQLLRSSAKRLLTRGVPAPAGTPARRNLALENLETRVVPASALQPGTEAQFVQSLYSDVLGRAGSAADVSVWVGDLKAGRSVESVAGAFLSSPEHLSRQVGELYQTVLARPVDPTGLQDNVGLLQRGGTERDVLAGLLGSAEYNAAHPGNADFVNSLYANVLHRAEVPPEQDFYLNLLSTGHARTEIVQGFLNSPERTRVEVNELFGQYLGRAADEAALANFAGALAAGNQSLAQIAVAVLASDENENQAVVVVPPAGNQNQIAEPPDTTAPFVTAAASAGNTAVRVTFSEDVTDTALDPARYSVTEQGVPLEVTAVAFVGGRRTVELTTAAQDDGSYTVAAAGVTDPAGNAATAAALAFTGTPNPLDTDADGLPDYLENRGWDVTVTKADGTTATRHVTSDPTKADTDADGLLDGKERELKTDPTAADTDADGLADPAELVARTVTVTRANGTTASRDVTSDPLKADTDADGLTDSEEAALHTDPRAADTDADGVTDAAEGQGRTITVTLPDGTTATRDVTSDPTKADTDADGLTDGQERDLATDPRAADTDADGLIDSTEVAGSDVTVTKADGTTATRHVASDPTKADTDGDGLLDAVERALGLDPTAADTDADAVTDFDELAGYRVTVVNADGTTTARDVTSDPLKADTDADGLTDGQERNLHTDPRNADTDGDELTDGAEVAGWQVSVKKINGTTATRTASSSPLRVDTDGDGLVDSREKFLGTDPTRADTDEDTLSDYAEVVEINSNPNSQDTDGDLVDDGTEFNILHTPVNSPPSAPDRTAPGVAGAVALTNTTVLLSFTEALSDSALNAANYFVTQTNVNSEAGTLRVLSAELIAGDRTVVKLTTSAQTDVSYTVNAVNLKDFGGNALSPRHGTFAGKPPVGAQIVDTDGDGVPDYVEQRGWTVAVKLLDGRTITRQVTSDPYTADTDGDGVRDDKELALSLDPRNADTDGDTLGDALEVNTIGSNASSQDTDGDGKDDGSEYASGGAAAVLTGAAPADTTPPRVVGAASLSNTTVLVSFSEAVSADNALNAAHYFIVQQNVNGEVGYVPVTGRRLQLGRPPLRRADDRVAERADLRRHRGERDRRGRQRAGPGGPGRVASGSTRPRPCSPAPRPAARRSSTPTATGCRTPPRCAATPSPSSCSTAPRSPGR